MSPICKKCNYSIKGKQFLTCAKCNGSYDLSCTNVGFRRYVIMTSKNKENWKCDPCWSKIRKEKEDILQSGPSNLNTAPTSFQQVSEPNYVTERKKFVINVSTDNSFSSLMTEMEDSEGEVGINDEEKSNESYTNGQDLNRSCPELITINRHFDIETLHKQLSTLQQKYDTAENEIELLLSENECLKKKIQECELKLNKFSNIYTPGTSKNQIINNATKTSTIKKKKKKMTRKTLSYSLAEDKTPLEKNQRQSQSGDSEIKRIPVVQEYKYKQKVCLVSSNPNNILKVAEKTFDEAKLCHYCIPGGGIHQLFDGLQNKLKNFSHRDYCIVYIGENDFLSTSNYPSLITFLREKVQNVQHTNVIICVPNYKLNNYSNLFNWRIEMFNNLLNLDNIAHQYAYILDSNLNLSYSSSMFSATSGRINRRGLSVTFHDLANLINDISKHVDETFFRQF